MADLETVKIKCGDGDYAIINKSDFDEDKHELFNQKGEGEATDHVAGMSTDGRNPSGTYSEPTPTDIRYPNKDHTEFENNHGAFVGKSAAQMREELGLADAPGGLTPDPNFDPNAGAAKEEPGLFNGADEAKFDHDADGEPGGSLTKAEIIADLEALKVDFDPRDKKADLLAQRDKARATR